MATPHKKRWPQNHEFYEAIQTPRISFSDKALKQAEPVFNDRGLPAVASGNFADVYQFLSSVSPDRWAVKCFTRPVHRQQDRYHAVSECLRSLSLQYTVGFEYLEDGIRIHGDWYPLLKMEWCDGFALNQYVADNADDPQAIQLVLDRWVDMAHCLRGAGIAHGDLQHGNVLVRPHDGSPELKLVDYDGMFVPDLAHLPPKEDGHPAFQHPARGQETRQRIEVDLFSHLVVGCALRALIVEGYPLWHRYDNGDNLLFREEDFVSPENSHIFAKLWQSSDSLTRSLVGHLILACESQLGSEPFLPDLLGDAVLPRQLPDTAAVAAILSRRTKTAREPRASTSQQPSPHPTRKAYRSSPAPVAPQTRPSSSAPPSPSSSQHYFGWLSALAGLAVCIVFFIYLNRAEVPGMQLTEIPPIEMELLSAGEYLMGTPKSEPRRREYEAPQQRVRIDSPFYISVCEVTRQQYQAIMGTDGSYFLTDRRNRLREENDLNIDQFPADNVPWLDALEFCNRLSLISGYAPCYQRSKDGQKVSVVTTGGFRLPTEEEWEYACRAQSATPFSFGKSVDVTKANLRYGEFTRPMGTLFGPTEVGSYPPNAFGIFDMHGNVAEWCWHTELSDDLVSSVEITRADARCVARGGSWDDHPDDAKSSARNSITPMHLNRRFYNGKVGFRIVRSVDDSTLPSQWNVAVAPLDSTDSTVTGINDFHIDPPIPIKMALIPSGRFLMGSPASEGAYTQFERPQHVVQFTAPFYVSAYEITQYQYARVMDADPSFYSRSELTISHVVDTSNFPVESVTWYDAAMFCNRLSRAEGRPHYYLISNVKHKTHKSGQSIVSADVSVVGGVGYRLPSEAEWEYACRAGTTTPFHFGRTLGIDNANMVSRDGLGKSDPYFSSEDSDEYGRAVPARIGSYPENAFGLFDMHGNVGEWCEDWYQDTYYKTFSDTVATNPRGPASVAYDKHIGRCRVERGGSWSHSPRDGRSGQRSFASPEWSHPILGFRVARSME